MSVLVPDYDDALAFYVGKLGFELVADTDLGHGKRWVLVAPKGAATSLLLARATDSRQRAAVGDQFGGRVGLFLHTDDFETDHAKMRRAGVTFEEPPRSEPYGRVAVWRDPFGNRWDLLELSDTTRGH